jgi:hypothetical protein
MTTHDVRYGLDYRRRIEEVTWRRTVWPAENARAKPTLDEAVPRAATAARVADGLRKASAPATSYGRPITPAPLRAGARVPGTGINRFA